MSDVDTDASRGKYTCLCREGFYVPNETLQGFTSAQAENGNNNTCTPCPRACSCDLTGQCLFQEDPDRFSTETLLKAAIGVVLGACMCCCVVLAIIVFRQRKCKVKKKNRKLCLFFFFCCSTLSLPPLSTALPWSGSPLRCSTHSFNSIIRNFVTCL